MKNILKLTALGCLAAGAASGQSYVAGLDFGVDSFASNVVFDKGSEASSFTLNIQSNADDNLFITTVTPPASDPGWSASNDLWSNGTISANANGSTIPINVQNSSAGGAATSNIAFGGTTATSQGFSSTNAIAFGANENGFFTISVGKSFNDVSINFDVAVLGSESQFDTGNLLVNSNSVAVSSAFTNQTVNLGNLTAGDLITFDLTNLDDGATFDNIMIAASPVPEPSAFAAIFGTIALGFAAIRRRRK